MTAYLQLASLYESIEGQESKSLIDMVFKKEKDYILTMMISAFHIFKNDYSVYKRRKLRNILRLLEKDCEGFNNSIEVLRFLENKDPYLSSS